MSFYLRLKINIELTDEELYKLVDLAVNMYGWPASKTSDLQEQQTAAIHTVERIVKQKLGYQS